MMRLSRNFLLKEYYTSDDADPTVGLGIIPGSELPEDECDESEKNREGSPLTNPLYGMCPQKSQGFESIMNKPQWMAENLNTNKENNMNEYKWTRQLTESYAEMLQEQNFINQTKFVLSEMFNPKNQSIDRQLLQLEHILNEFVLQGDMTSDASGNPVSSQVTKRRQHRINQMLQIAKDLNDRAADIEAGAPLPPMGTYRGSDLELVNKMKRLHSMLRAKGVKTELTGFDDEGFPDVTRGKARIVTAQHGTEIEKGIPLGKEGAKVVAVPHLKNRNTDAYGNPWTEDQERRKADFYQKKEGVRAREIAAESEAVNKEFEHQNKLTKRAIKNNTFDTYEDTN